MYHYFQVERFWVVFGQKTVPILSQLEQSALTRLNYDMSSTSHKKGSVISAMDWEKLNFSKIVLLNFLYYVTSLLDAIS